MTPSDYAALLSATAGRVLGELGDALGSAMAEALPAAAIAPPLRLAHFLAQTCHETGGYRWLTELASGDAYDGRADLGNTQPGDGALFKGRGLIQITGRANYARIGVELGVNLIADPDLAATPEIAVKTAVLYWMDHGLNALADADDTIEITRRINGGLNGLADRVACLNRARAAIAALPPAPIPAPAPPEAAPEPAAPEALPMPPTPVAPAPGEAPGAPDDTVPADLPPFWKQLLTMASGRLLAAIGAALAVAFPTLFKLVSIDAFMAIGTGAILFAASIVWGLHHETTQRQRLVAAINAPAPSQHPA